MKRWTIWHEALFCCCIACSSVGSNCDTRCVACSAYTEVVGWIYLLE